MRSLSLVLRKLVFVLAVTLRSYMLEVYIFVFGEGLTVTLHIVTVISFMFCLWRMVVVTLRSSRFLS